MRVRLNRVVELICTRKMHMALPDCSGIPQQGTPYMRPMVQNCHLWYLILAEHWVFLAKKVRLFLTIIYNFLSEEFMQSNDRFTSLNKKFVNTSDY